MKIEKTETTGRLILGIDPGVSRVGYCIAKINYSDGEIVECGIIENKPSVEISKRLVEIYERLMEILCYYRPFAIGIESIFFFKNQKTAIDVSQARGVIVLAASQQKIPIIDVTPLEVKNAICGYGRAEKPQIEKMVMRLFRLKKPLKPDDISDAAAIAWTAGSYLIRSSGGV